MLCGRKFSKRENLSNVVDRYGTIEKAEKTFTGKRR